jgi:hypothetical protein
MIWSDPWIDVATTPPPEGTGVSPFCTTLPPPRPTLPPELRFRCEPAAAITDTALSDWRTLVGTQWPVTALRQRLADAWVAELRTDGNLVATCVLRRGSAAAVWILETLVARPTRRGYATALVRSAITWIWETGQRGPFVLAYTWELSVAQLAVAWWRGWLKSAAAYESGWIWVPQEGCSFCGSNTDRNAYPVGPAMPLIFRSAEGEAILSDSGLGDGLGYVLACRGAVDWTAVIRRGGWRALWWRGTSPPSLHCTSNMEASSRAANAWQRTGEVIVVGLLNYDGRSPGIPTRWVTAEVAPASQSP